jgi:hypothetical protein
VPPAGNFPSAPPNAQPGFTPFQQPPGQFAPPAGPPGALPSRPGFTPPQANPLPPAGLPQQIDDLIASSAAAASTVETAKERERRLKKGRDMKLVFYDEKVSPEEKMAALPRFADFMQT